MTKGDRVFPRWFPFARFGRDGKVRLRMTILTTSLDRRSEVFAANAAAMRVLVEDLREKCCGDPRGRRGGGAAPSRSSMTSAGGCGRLSSALPRFLRLVLRWMRPIKKRLSVPSDR